MSLDTNNGIKVYTPFSLKLYDWWVLNISNRYAWRCHTGKYLLPHFLHHMSDNHLDIGVGTGFYPKQAAQRIKQISFSDLNNYSLEYAKKCLGENKISECLQHDVFHPFPDNMKQRFDSVSIFYLLHCLPGMMQDKKAAIMNITETLTQNGVLYGATILGDGVQHNRFGQKLMAVYNKKGIFSNHHDSKEALHNLLSSLFKDVQVKIEGKVALFSACNRK